jgi:hypothetical protein
MRGIGKKAFLENLLSARSGIGPVSYFDSSIFNVHSAGEIKDWVPERYFPPHRLKRLDRYAQFAVGSAVQRPLRCKMLGSIIHPMTLRLGRARVLERLLAGWRMRRSNIKRLSKAVRNRSTRRWRFRSSEDLAIATRRSNLGCAAWGPPIPMVALAVTWPLAKPCVTSGTAGQT